MGMLGRVNPRALFAQYPLRAKLIPGWTLGLASAYLYTWTAVGIGSYFREYGMPLLGAGALCVPAAAVAGVLRRGRLAQALWILAVLLLVPIYAAFEVRSAKTVTTRH